MKSDVQGVSERTQPTRETAPADWRESSVRRVAFHALPVEAVCGAFQATDHGLSEEEARLRLAVAGPNRLPEQPPPSVLVIFARQFSGPLIFVLLVAAGLAVATQDYESAGFIGVVLVLNALIGGYQEWRAERSSRALQRFLKTRASVMRDGDILEVDADQLVPGDIVWLESGNRVPADARLVSARGLEIDESLLTGESLPVHKDADFLAAEATPLADRRNMAHAGTVVSRGRGKALVVATGAHTSLGELATEVARTEEGKPPLIVRMETFSRKIAVVVLAASAAIALLGMVGHGYSVVEMVVFGIALAVSAIPEGLPVAMTVALAVACTRMARRGVIVRRLAAVEGLGSCTLIASDKTGTLTCNELTVRDVRTPDGRVFSVSGHGFTPVGEASYNDGPVDPEDRVRLEELARAVVLCNEGELHHRNGAWIWHGDPTDVALLSLAHKLGRHREATLDRHPRLGQIPFEPELRYSASYHDVEGNVMVFVKGAPERVVPMCRRDDESAPAAWLELADDMARRGFRVLAIAKGRAAAEFRPADVPPAPRDLEFLGLVGMIDPLRPGVREAVAACRQAGVAVSMVTGDHPVTALAIARELGMANRADEVTTGSELEGLSPEELRRVVEKTRVFARVVPRQKLEIVEAARAAGHFVAVTGDGVNDAPALRKANIGVAMGRGGTDVAREASELVISDDNFATIVAGIEEGRVAYDNVRKVIYLLISTGAAEVALVGLAVAFGLPLPLTAVQLLWLNLVTNGIQDVALAFEPGEGDTLRRPPRSPREPIFNRLMIERTLIAAAVMGVVGFAAFYGMIASGWTEAAARNSLLLLMVLFENVHIGNCRSETKSALTLSPLRSPLLLFGAIGALLVHVAAMHVGFLQGVLETAPVDWRHWAVLFSLALTIFVAMEIHKLIWALRHPRIGAPPPVIEPIP
jgi:Ca2+-transporting ATPase